MTGKGNSINQTIKDQFRIAMQNKLPRTKLLVLYIKNSEMKLINFRKNERSEHINASLSG